ncbi:Uma2 family endonuclease [Leptolyngbya iicbica]|uniref:Uma2 family endonuclease n=2 Tax=Cyanophyceae TaxID=3028117 RepID=A0A4Q7EJB5_9CYAN|nr:Uma2 family endonuclease [Leptolyngbya sp. LK]RZM81889.1 Uma2 family endonuclease [Leptolyngbya sp. LK]
MVESDRYRTLPTSDELPDSDGLPVDNEEQNLLPNYLLFLLQFIWPERYDWYFAVDMGIYHLTGVNPRVPVVPDGFLSLGIPRRKPGRRFRKSYVTWEEDGIAPILLLEVVSQTPGGEYDNKRAIYQNLGVLYYVIYNPEYWQRDRHQPFEVYKLIEGEYRLQLGEPYWMPEVGLGLGRFQGELAGIEQELLSWFDQQGQRYLSATEQASQAQQQALQAQQQALQAEAAVQTERQARLSAVQRLQQMGLSAEQIAAALGLSIEVVTQHLE